ncbi:DUF3043 domain-containing protein [Paenarthrobacter sp. Z7-10]|uniref:DUF3043 domain-containing protein n=1 Tax=Paenarthrobacter sp. Z7-10 TaxID=2787635 RepID=UPI0022A991FD|nr:DUF3043 domain-containing protein [Paenarthrobacter sp. Z7-10]MCZ2404304.1 DUF3043 domain-containing protein [Paenarthrobacter sp. Z7-10]
MFGRKKETAASPTAADELAAQAASRPVDPRARKGAPTPSRRAQEAARRRPLVPDDRKAAKSADRDAHREEQARMRRALDTGEERYLPVRDKGPQKRFARDFVDSRFSLGEYVMFAALAIVILSLLVTVTSETQIIIFGIFWVLVIAVGLDSFLLGRKLKRGLREKFGSVDSGVIWYGTMRSLQFRRLRLPKPLVKRGGAPK